MTVAATSVRGKSLVVNVGCTHSNAWYSFLEGYAGCISASPASHRPVRIRQMQQTRTVAWRIFIM